VREEERDRMEAVAYYQAYVRGGEGPGGEDCQARYKHSPTIFLIIY
jgi:hypothetical protein